MCWMLAATILRVSWKKGERTELFSGGGDGGGRVGGEGVNVVVGVMVGVGGG